MKTSIGNIPAEAIPPMSADEFASHLVETWIQDPEDHDLWHGEHGVIVNTAALEMRKAFYTIVKQTA